VVGKMAVWQEGLLCGEKNGRKCGCFGVRMSVWKEVWLCGRKYGCVIGRLARW
jgi:hypothetical protein